MSEDIHGEVRGPDPGDRATNVSKVRSVKNRSTGYVLLDSTWARRLGVRRSGGLYRIARRELMEGLKHLQQTPMEQVVSPSVMQDGHGFTANESPLGDVVGLGHSHFVEFYETDAFLAGSVRDFLAPGLLAGDTVVVVATDAHHGSFDRTLTEAGIDLPDARRRGQFIALDASQTLEKFMVDGVPDAARFRATIGQLISPPEGGCDVRIYGEMVAVLWNEQNLTAAIALESLWNDLATTNPFSLFCAYPMRAFATDASTEAFRRICAQHSEVVLEGAI